MSAVAVRERPILFSAPMVRAILDGRKTQTRRVIRRQPSEEWLPKVERYHPAVIDREGYEQPGAEVFGAADENEGRVCPFGAPGDRLWVREAWAESEDQFGGSHLVFRADMRASLIGADGDSRVRRAIRYRLLYEPQPRSDDPDDQQWTDPESWRPSIHMPRWASRITLEVVRVGVERVQEISVEDVRAEGIPELYGEMRGWVRERFPKIEPHEWDNMDFRQQWETCWDSINAKRGHGWAANPWVWVVEFKRVSQAVSPASEATPAAAEGGENS